MWVGWEGWGVGNKRKLRGGKVTIQDFCRYMGYAVGVLVLSSRLG